MCVYHVRRWRVADTYTAPSTQHTHCNTQNTTHKQIYYVYGQRKSGDVDKSYQMGFGGGSYPRNPHHRATSCDDQGGWVGGRACVFSVYVPIG